MIAVAEDVQIKTIPDKELLNEMDYIFEKYRLCKYLVDASEQENAEIRKYKKFCLRIENAVEKLAGPEKLLIKERFMKDDYVMDQEVYQNVLLVSAVTFTKRRNIALKKLHMILTLEGFIK